MNHEPRLPRTDVNVTPRHPLKEGVVMLVGLFVIVGVFLGMTTLIVDRLVPYVPQSWEARLFPDFSDVRYEPESDEERRALAELEALLDRLSAHWPERPEELTIGLMDASAPNALAFPGGLILVTTGLMEAVESENELAFVLGHELGHYRNRDHLKSLGRGLALGLILTAAGQSGAAGDLAALAGDLTSRRFSREQEMKADAFGLSLVADEFGHVHGATDFFERLPKPEGAVERSLASYLATHPLTDARIEGMRTLAEEKGLSMSGEITPF